MLFLNFEYRESFPDSLPAYLIDKILKAQSSEKAREQIRDFLGDAPLLLPTLKELEKIEDGCKVDAIVVGADKKATLTINIQRFPNQRAWLGKKVGDVLKTTSATLSYRVERIYEG